MVWSSIRRRIMLAGALAGALAGFAVPRAEAQQKPKIIKSKPTPAPAKTTDDQASVEPDKVLYDRAMKSMKSRRFTEARLDLQTLINTYPDSEYLAKAKLAIADSFYREGGTSSLTQSIEEYKNFIVFFPFLDEAAYAQMQVAMAHYRMMEKADRDSSQALAAETEFQIFLQKYPQSKLYPEAEQNLRNVQEVLADGEFRIARFYYVKTDYRASAARLVEVSERYPLYSQGDQALWMLADVYMRAKQASKNEDDKNHWADLAAKCYARIVTDYPLSKFAPGARNQLQGMGMAAPAADPAAADRMKKSLAYQQTHHPNTFTNGPISMFKTAPDVTFAARQGTPNLNPPDDAVSATDVLRPGAVGPSFGIASSPTGGGSDSNGDSGSVVTPEDSSSSAPGNSTAVQILEAPSGDAAAGQPTGSPAPADGATSSSSSSSSSSAPAATSAPALSSVPDSSGASTSVNPQPDTSVAGAPSNNTAPAAAGDSGNSANGTVNGTSNSNSSQPSSTSSSSSSSQGESTSKKKKGLHKIVPF